MGQLNQDTDNFNFFDSLEAATKWIEYQPSQKCMAEV
jgi:hypothetical protein